MKIESSKTKPAKCRKEAAQLSLVYRDISKLKLDPRNPRHHSERQIIQIARSIEVFGFNVPILIDRDGNVIAGHGRLLACKKLGFRKVATIGLDHLTRAQIRAFMIADNRLTENSEWDERLLAQALKDLSLLNLDFSLEDTGFEMGEIDFRIQGLEGNQETGEDPGDALPQSSIPAVSRPGDLWMLDKSLVYCGSALDARAYTLLFGSERASMVITDQPFNRRIENNVSGLGAICHRNFAMASGEMDEAEFTEFLTSSCSLMAKYSVDGSIHFLFMDWRHMTEMLSAGREIYTELKNLCVWTKNHTGMGAFYRSRHELVFVFKNGRGSHRNNIQLGRYGRDRTNVWTYPSPRTRTDEGYLLALHPTVKPVALVADAIMDCSARGDIILDPFLGSGTTVIAAQRTDRRCYGIEIDPIYVDTIVRRWQEFTRDTAHHAVSGRTFDEVRKERTVEREKNT